MTNFVTTLLGAVFLVGLATSCARKDNSADTDEASEDLRNAQSAVTEKRKDLAVNEHDIETTRRDLVDKQQQLTADQKALEANRQQLGSSTGTLAEARVAYSAALTERFAKLDAALAGVATQTDVASKDATIGLQARRDTLASKLASLPVTPDPGWAEYTRDVDSTFDLIERDLRAAKH